jgi:hypothetical protein
MVGGCVEKRGQKIYLFNFQFFSLTLSLSISCNGEKIIKSEDIIGE